MSTINLFIQGLKQKVMKRRKIAHANTSLLPTKREYKSSWICSFFVL